MKGTSIKDTLISIIIFIFSSILALGFIDQGSKWKGQTRTINGINCVLNPREPIFDEKIFDLKEEYKIRSTDNIGHYVFNKPVKMLLDEHNNLYVLDPPEGNIKIFDERGRFLRIIGNKGQGPGELDIPAFISVLNQDEIVIADAGNRRMNIYSLNGGYKRSISTATMTIKDMDSDSNGNIFCIIQTRVENHFRYDLQKFDSSLTLLKTYRQDNDYVAIKPSFFVASPCLAISKNSRIIYGFPDKDYEFDVLNDNGKIINRIQKDFARSKIPDEEIENVTKKMPKSLEIYIPKYYPPYYNINVDDEARIIVLSQYQYRTKIWVFDVFTPDGKYLTELSLRNLERPDDCVWRKNKLYTIEEDSDGLPVVVVYQIQWKY